MTDFNAGDRVIWSTHPDFGPGTVVEDDGLLAVRFDNFPSYDDSDSYDYHTPPLSELVKIDDPVNHPSHYTQFGAEVIEITEHLSFCAGNAVKYLSRAGLKDPSKHIEDLEKAAWYVSREIERVKKLNKE